MLAVALFVHRVVIASLPDTEPFWGFVRIARFVLDTGSWHAKAECISVLIAALKINIILRGLNRCYLTP